MSISIHQLESFIRIVNCGSFSKAAEQLYITPSALIQQMNNLEKHLGFSLFKRNNQGISLTSAGKRLCEHAEPMLKMFQDTVSECRNIAQSDSILKLGYDPSRPQCQIFDDQIDAFNASFPNIPIMKIIEFQENYTRAIQENRIDICPYSMEPSMAGLYHFFPVFSNPRCILMKNNHRLSRKDIISPEDLTDERIAFGDIKRQPDLVAWCRKNSRCQLVNIPTDFATVMKHCAEGGLCFIPELYSENTKPLIAKRLDENLNLLHGYLHNNSSNAKKFISFIKKKYGSHITDLPASI